MVCAVGPSVADPLKRGFHVCEGAAIEAFKDDRLFSYPG